MSDVSEWDELANGNTDPSPDGFPEGMPPSGVNDSAREVMAATKRFYDELTDPASLTPLKVQQAAVADTSKTLRHSVDPANPDLEPLEEDDGDWYVNRANHFGTIAPAVISPQPNNGGLNASTLQGLTAAQVAATPKYITAPAWMNNFGGTGPFGGEGNQTLGAGVTNIGKGVHYRFNLTIPSNATLRLVEQGNLIIYVRNNFTCSGTIDVSGRGGIGGAEGANNAEGGYRFIGGGGSSGLLGDGIGQPSGATRWRPAQQPADPNVQGLSANPSDAEFFEMLNFWTPDILGGSGGGSQDGGADSNGGNGGGIIIIIANNFDFTGVMNARGRENLNIGGDNDLADAGVGGGGCIFTAAQNTINNSGQRRINAPIPAGLGNVDTGAGGVGLSVHLDLTP